VERLVPSSILKEHWTLTTVMEKWALDATKVCNLAWTHRRCCCWKAGSRVLEFIEAGPYASRRDMDHRSHTGYVACLDR